MHRCMHAQQHGLAWINACRHCFSAKANVLKRWADFLTRSITSISWVLNQKLRNTHLTSWHGPRSHLNNSGLWCFIPTVELHSTWKMMISRDVLLASSVEINGAPWVCVIEMPDANINFQQHAVAECHLWAGLQEQVLEDFFLFPVSRRIPSVQRPYLSILSSCLSHVLNHIKTRACRCCDDADKI